VYLGWDKDRRISHVRRVLRRLDFQKDPPLRDGDLERRAGHARMEVQASLAKDHSDTVVAYRASESRLLAESPGRNVLS
jgi:hypothetical protein